ncbi:MAG: nucleotidyltransferase [Acidobacteria bacterium]|nr:MAG: nucleotidyltransferase [Acidobacteriota bacterium]
MKAMILAAGLGTRMRPLTLVKAKAALPVLNRPLLHWTLELLAAHGVREAMINLHHLPRTVRAAVGDGRAFGVKVAYSYEPEILGTGGGPRKVRRWLGDEPFLLVNGDVVFDFDLTRLFRAHARSGARVTLALIPNPDPRKYSGVVTGPDGRVRSIASLPRAARGTISMFPGVHVLDPALLDRLPPGASDTVRDLYAPLIAEGSPPLGVRLRGPWYDLGSPSLYLASHQSLLASRFRGSRRGSVIHPEARVHPRARVTRSVVGKGAVIEQGADVRGSVLWDRVRVGRDADVEASILATGVRLADGEALGHAVLMKGQPRAELTR